MSANRGDRDVKTNRSSTKSRRRSKRAYSLETLESRVVLSYTFSYDPLTQIAAASGSTIGAVDSLVLEPAGGFLLHSVNGGAFDSDWGGQTVPIDPLLTVNVTLSSGDGSSITLGTATGPASDFGSATLNVLNGTGNTSDTSTIDDSHGTTLASPIEPYSIDTQPGTISGPGFNYSETGSTPFAGGVVLMGSPVDGNLYNVESTFGGEPTTIETAAGTTSTVDVGSGGTLNINAPLAIFDPGDATTVNINDASDTTNSTATLDNLSGNASAPFEVTGLSASPIEYGPGVTALNINGGTSGGTGVTYNINNTQLGTTTTINGGPNTNTYNLADSTSILDSNVLGPVVVNGGGAGDQISVDDSASTADDNYTVTDTTVTSTGAFGGLTYGGLGAGALNFLASQGNNDIDINDTADGVDTSVSGEAGTDTINVNDTGTGATLFISTGNNTSEASTVNVLADNEQVNISSFASFPTVTTVNIGSNGGPGTMANIQGPISVVNSPSLTSLNFHDENDTTGQTWTLDNDDTVPTGTVAVTGSATTTYDPSDLSDMTVNGGSGGNTFIVNNTSGNYPTTLNTGAGADTTNVFATGDFTLNINGQNGTDTVTLGGSTAAPLGMQGLTGTINVGNAVGLTNLVLDDSQDTAGQTALLFNDGTNGAVTGLSPATINYSDGDGGISSLTVNGGSGGNTFTVDGTLNNPGVIPAITDLFTGSGDDTTFVEATNANGPLNIHGQGGQDAVIIGDFGSLTGILGPVSIDNDSGFTDLTVDASVDDVSHTINLSSTVPTTALTGLAPADITYTTLDLSSLTINTSDFGTQVMNIDMSGGNPIPYTDSPGLTWNASPDGTGALGSHALNIFGELPTGPFASETHNANDQSVFPQVGQYGSISFDDGQGLPNSLTSLWYTGLSPITDTTPAIDYTFNDDGYPDQSFSATTGPIVGGFQTVEFASTPTPPFPTNFETTDIANKNFVVFNTPPAVPVGAGVIGTVNVPVPSDGLLSLTFNTLTGGDNNVSFVNTPPGVVTSLNGGAAADVTNVTGLGVADGTVLFLNGGAGTNTLNYDAGGEVPSITPGLLPGELLITIPGAGIVDAVNYQVINITDVGPLVITPGPAAVINTVEDFQNVDTIVGTFTAPILPFPGPPGFPASDFTASIDWGDPSPDPSAGTITQDASNPSIYYITGTHTFLENGTFTVDNTVAFAGGSFTVPVNGVPVTITFGPAGPTAGTSATATVTQGPLAVTAFPVVGTEGIAIAAAPIGTFIDAGGVDLIANYSATIDIFDSGGTLVDTFPAASITQNADANEFTVNAPAFTLPEEGTYQVVVSVTESGGTTPITVSGTSTAVIADAPLTAGPELTPTANTGVPVSFDRQVGSFTDANLGATDADFTGVVDWGDGSPDTLASISNTGLPAGTFNVYGNHTFAKPGQYNVVANVLDAGGSTVSLFAVFTVTDLPVTGSVRNFTGVEGQNTGTIVVATFEDPNTLATVADVHATLPIGGWGDGNPTGVATLQVIQAGVDETTGEPIFQVLGNHTYIEEGDFTVNINVTTSGGVTMALTPATAAIFDAPLSSSNGTVITGIEGNSTGTILLGTFTDANQGSTIADFTTPPGSTVVNWGDGSAPQTLTAASLAAVGSANGVIYTVRASHTYAEEGTYAYNVTVTDDGGAVTIFSGEAIIADAPLSRSPTQPAVNTIEAALFPVPVFAPPVFSGAVASFTDANSTAPISDFETTIDWGDGTPMTAGTVSQPGGVGTPFIVSGMHTYADAGVNGGVGHYAIQVFVQDAGGARLTIANTANVLDRPILLTGILNPSSDSGLFTGAVDVTNDNQPDFFGNSEPLSHITLFAEIIAGGPLITIGEGTADAAGDWNIQSRLNLPDGNYEISADAVDQFGVTTTLETGPGISTLSGGGLSVLRAVITPDLTIDTPGPVVTGVFFNRLNGQVDYTIQDPGPAPSGVWIPTLLDSSNYELTKVHPQKNFPGKYIVTNVTVNADPTLANAFDVAVTFNAGETIRGGFYLFTIRDSSNALASVQNRAGDHLDGEFYGTFPSGNGIIGGDFVAELQAFHDKVFAPQTIIGTANAKNLGVGGNRVGAVKSGVFVPVIPRGGSPIFSTPTSPAAAKKKTSLVKANAKHSVKVVAHHETSHAKKPKVVVSHNHPKGPRG